MDPFINPSRDVIPFLFSPRVPTRRRVSSFRSTAGEVLQFSLVELIMEICLHLLSQVNGHKNNYDDGEVESELSEPTSTVHSPSGLNELEDEIVVGQRTNGRNKSSPLPIQSDNEDETMADAGDEPIVSHYPKRKRNSVFHDLSESKMEVPALNDKTAQQGPVRKPGRQSLGSVKGVTLGYWRDSQVPNEKDRHAVIGFIDVRDRLRTRIQPMNQAGASLAMSYPLPPGPGGSWVTFEKVVFNKHLVGLDHFQVKEYVRLRSESSEDTEEARRAAERAAVKEAIRRVKENPLIDNITNPPLIAYGPDLPDGPGGTPNRPDAKRRRTSGGFSAINPLLNGVSQESLASQQLSPSGGLRPEIDPLPGTRPTRILLGYWRGSSETDPKNRHAVYGILGQNDMFRVKLVRETRDGRFVDGNFPVGAGALWIQYEEVEFEEHLKPLARTEVKEYCRVRQWQIDHGEKPEERIANETKAVYDAQARISAGAGILKGINHHQNPSFAATPDEVELSEAAVPKTGFGGHELRQSRRVEAKNDARASRQSLAESETRPAESRASVQAAPTPPAPAARTQSVNAVERTNTLARREIARVEAQQGRADQYAANRERAAAAALDAANAAAAAIPTVNGTGRVRLGESEDVQRLNKVWARQENLRVKAGAEDAKIYGGIKYERKSNGPFMGKLVSQGTIISIDGEDYVEYRVLTRPSFF